MAKQQQVDETTPEQSAFFFSKQSGETKRKKLVLL
jgi:hypothetical protein